MLKKILLAILISNFTFAIMFLDVEIIHEKGIDGKTILKSELLSKEIIENKKEVFLQMKNGIRVILFPEFEEEKDIVTITGILQKPAESNNKKKDFKITVKKEESSKSVFSSNGNKTILKLTPRSK